MLAEDRQREQARLARQRELDAEAAKDRQLEVEAERKRAERKAEMDRKDQEVGKLCSSEMLDIFAQISRIAPGQLL